MKKYLPWVITVLVVIAFTMRDCRTTAEYRSLVVQYNGYRAIAEADHALSLGRIDELNKKLSESASNAVALELESAGKDRKIAELSKRVDELQNEEPPTTPDIEALPIVISLRGQVKTLTEMFTLAQENLGVKDRGIKELKSQVVLLEAVAAEWKANYDREHGLRLAAEKVIAAGRGKKWSAKSLAVGFALGVAGAFILK